MDGCEPSGVAELDVGIGKRVARTDAIAEYRRGMIDGEEVDERVVRVERALRSLEGR